MQRMAAVARPFVWLMGLSTNAILYLFGRRQVESVKVSIEDIEHLLKTGIQTGVLEPAEQAVARKALHLGDRRVRDIVRPRVEMESLDVDTPPDEVIGAIAMADDGYDWAEIIEHYYCQKTGIQLTEAY